MIRTEGLQIAGLEGGLLDLPARVIDALASAVHGAVWRRDDVGMTADVRTWNGLVSANPALVVQPLSVGDVVQTVKFARSYGLLMSIRGGGHNIAGTSVAENCLALDMSHMRDVTVDPDAKIAHVGPGCLLKDVDGATQQHGLAAVLGFVSEVGVAGLTLGGGLGYLTRRFGWTVDNLHEVQIVTADGEIRVASNDAHPDLFWAIRGAGANFGVVTRFTFRLHPVGPAVRGGLIAWPFERADEILRTYRILTAQAPREFAVWLILMHAPPAPFVPEEWHGRKICAMVVCDSGDLAHADARLAPLRSLGHPVFDLIAERPYTEMQSFFDASEPKGMHYYWKTDYVEELTDAQLSLIHELFAECSIPGAEIGLLHLGGALNERAEDDGAIGNRTARYARGINGMWEPDEPEADRYTRWIRSAWERLRPFSTGRTYVNFQTADEGGDRIRATYGLNFERLVDVKTRYDPLNLFRVNRNVRPRPCRPPRLP